MQIGPHLSIAQGFPNAARTALRLEATTFQYFSRNPRGGNQRQLTEQEVTEWLAIKREQQLGPVVQHIPYTVNLAAPVDATWEFAVRVVAEDSLRAAEVGASFMVVHPGSHTQKSDEERGMRRIVEGIGRVRAVLDELHARGRDTTRSFRDDEPDAPWLCLETMSGQGTEIGHRPQQLAAMMDALDWPSWLGVCLDTCHVFAAGYDLRTADGLERLLEDLNETVGLERVKVLHVNDSKMPLGSRSDRHACIGEGEIGLEALLRVIEHPALQGRPVILETPVEPMPDGWADEIRMLRRG